MGALNEFIRKNYATHRTFDANFSHALLGKNSERLMRANSHDTFGKDGFFAAFKALNGKVLLLGDDKIGGTLFHHVEKMAGVSYRFDKKFKGILQINDEKTPHLNIFFARKLDTPSIARPQNYIKRSLKSYKIAKIKNVVVASYGAKEHFKKTIKKLKKDEKCFL
ncbi:hypothetical protein LBC_16450 [Campylobacter sp. 19-13652]|nr:hypothetical protein LBC_16450 [Campylobacter sp. 19-13652]